jgi:hypothetical protein
VRCSKHEELRKSSLSNIFVFIVRFNSSRNLLRFVVAYQDHTLNTLRYADRVKERDPQTGELSSTVAVSSKIPTDHTIRVKMSPPRPVTAPAASFRIEGEEDWSDDDAIPPPPFDESNLVDDDEYSMDADKNATLDSLDEALKSSDTLSVPQHGPVTENQAAKSLIATHKSILAEMLIMLQQDMALVNDADTNRNIDEYLKELEQLSDKQLSLLSTLRESLVRYNYSKQGTK